MKYSYYCSRCGYFYAGEKEVVKVEEKMHRLAHRLNVAIVPTVHVKTGHVEWMRPDLADKKLATGENTKIEE